MLVNRLNLRNVAAIVACLAVTAVFSGCNEDKPEPTGRIPVNLTTNIVSSTLKVANDQWDVADHLGLYMKKAGQLLTTSGAVYNDVANVQMRISGGMLTSATQVLYPEAGNVDFVAYYPYTASVDANFTIPVSVAGQAAGLPVEFLYSNNVVNQVPTASAVTLNFLYSLAKLELTVMGDVLTAADFSGMTASIEGMFTQARLQLANGTFTGHQAKQTITLHKTGSDATSATFEALVLPANVTAGDVAFVFNAGGENYRIEPAESYVSATSYALEFKLEPGATASLNKAVIIPRNTIERSYSVGKSNDNLYIQESKYIRLEIEKDLISITPAQLFSWLSNLDMYYEQLVDVMNGMKPFRGDKIIIRSVSEIEAGYAWARAGNPITWNNCCDFIQNTFTDFVNNGDWSFGILHEIGHNFGLVNGPYNWNEEMFANFRMYLAAIKMPALTVDMDGIKSGTEWWDISVQNDYNTYGVGNNKKTESGLDWTLCRIGIHYQQNNDRGYWLFKSAFERLNSLPPVDDSKWSRWNRFNYFLDALSHCAGEDVRITFSSAELELILYTLGDPDDIYSLIPILLPSTPENTPHSWRYTFDNLDGNWYSPSYNDALWSIGNAPFGTLSGAGFVGFSNTEWTTEKIYLRTHFNIDNVSSIHSVYFFLFHDEDVDIYVNGHLALSLYGYDIRYKLIEFDKTLLENGVNTIAAKCSNNAGSQLIDIGVFAAMN